MKNFLIALITCLLTGVLTFFGLTKFGGGSSMSNDTEVVQNVEEGEDEDGEDTDEEEDDEFSDEDDDETDDDDDFDDDWDEDDDEGTDEVDDDEAGNEEVEDEEKVEVSDGDTDEDVEDEKQKTTKKANVKKSVSSIDSEMASILSDYKKWSNYNDENIELSYDFTPYDENGNKISKEEFLEKQKTGDYIPVKDKESELTYRLLKLSGDFDEKIKKGSRSKASTALYYYKQEGREFPNFDAADLNGSKFSSDKSKGKLLIVKCWFVRCVVCVKEFPELNEIYDKYEGNSNIEFLSFAFEKEDELKTFLKKKKFRYPVIPEHRKFITKEIKARQYPLHVVVGKDGKILKMVNNVKALKYFIEKNI